LILIAELASGTATFPSEVVDKYWYQI